MPKKIKSDPSKRYKARYGSKIRKKIAEIERESKAKHECPKCKTQSLKREGTGIWSCRKCGKKTAGGAYKPQTPIGAKVKRTLKEVKEETEE
ncbi:50S ribosomal protein L37ae [Methanonatronarchaeum sp. AMET6-2]|uniref:50S ribosomal protein L37ae n=1 Tax=Methanonatronarchaeum sp. AMET6-2 TaxID=2933293 RepID=UPI00120400BF|nr:50S ribosomal protein L37ae [Methanonatronarchaeum sp. AMET6-2]RZN63069.1 MAG: 50S ribosomal protein L37ae [Methanonatronarchaeia archaeon]UOY09597.1 50S ribosomal protein L37ae [Methanonatronarchaeum sp. AMET6-2]